ncbi:Uncharacterized protein DAT39_016714, partial [Clarias magur]
MEDRPPGVTLHLCPWCQNMKRRSGLRCRLHRWMERTLLYRTSRSRTPRDRRVDLWHQLLQNKSSDFY